MSRAMSSLPAPWSVDAGDAFEAFLTRLSPKARLSVDKHLEACDADAALSYGRCWRRLVGTLGRLASHHVEVGAPFAVRFFIADGRYRQQVFALEDARKGVLQLYLPDIAQAAIAKDLLVAGADGRTYTLASPAGSTVQLETMTSDSPDVPAYLKPMLGWNRRALRTTIEAGATEKHVKAIEALCEVAAEAWKAEPGKVAPAV